MVGESDSLLLIFGLLCQIAHVPVVEVTLALINLLI